MVKVAACTLACLATVEACVSLDQYECWFFSVESHTGPFGAFSQSSYGCSGTIEVPAFFGDTSNWISGSYGYTVDDRGITRSDGLTGTFGSSGDKFQIKWADGATHTEDPMKICSRSADELAHPGNAKLALPEMATLSTSRCSGSCCDDYCQCPGYEDHYCGSNGCDCGLSSNLAGCQYPYAPVQCDAANFTISRSADELPHPGNAKLALPEMAKLSTSRCSGSCCDDYCQCPGYEDHYCGSNGCDCGLSSNLAGCQYPYAPVQCDAANFTISV